VTPLQPYGADTPPLVLTTLTQAGGKDQRARFREIYCAVLDARVGELPDIRPCDEALTRVGTEPSASGKPVDLGRSKRGLVAALVPGVGFDCFARWLEPQGTTARHVERFGYRSVLLQVDALSGTATNARQIRDALMAMPVTPGAPRIVLVGYSKGAPDVLEAVVTYPEIRPRVAAVVSLAGAVGGSPLANDAEQYQAELLQYFPGSTCDAGDGGAVASLRPDVRKAWLASHALPSGLRYYSLVTYPQPERVSQLLQGSYRKLSMVDGRNDSQMIFYDQVIPGSTLVGYLNADHWAVVVPIARTHESVASLFVTHNDYPREAMLEALLRFVEEDLQN
jgi:dienelactone hydrolase